LKIIDDDIDYFAGEYDKLQNELELIEQLPDSATKEEIIRKLHYWFFDCLFTPALTGLAAIGTDKERILNIFKTYRETGRKTYKIV